MKPQVIVLLALLLSAALPGAKAGAESENAGAAANITDIIQTGKVGSTLEIPIPGAVALHLAYCPSGTFQMGSPSSEEGRTNQENQVQVEIRRAFWLAKTETTQAQWKAVMGNAPSKFAGDPLPVEQVSWDEVQQFITKLNASGTLPKGWKFALPTEAQWEYACRAGTTGPLAGASLDDVAWHKGNSGFKTHPVGTKAPNAWGLHDMHGGVYEWCADWLLPSLQGGVDPRGPASGTHHVHRGGSWNSGPAICRSAARSASKPDYRLFTLGFRLALVPSE